MHGELYTTSLTSHGATEGNAGARCGLPLGSNGKWQFLRIKDFIAKTASQLLRYYDRMKPVIVQTNASQRGLGACLIQEGQLIAFASKSLTDTETRYTNIEHELIIIVFACQKFNTYIICPWKAIYCRVRPQALGYDTSEESCKCPSQTPENIASVTAIWCDHQIQTREGHAACRCAEQMALTSFWGNQIGYESWLHCLQQDLDHQAEGGNSGGPYSKHSVPAHSAGAATSKETYSINGQGILGLVTERPLHCNSILPPWGVSGETSPWPPFSHKGPTECSSTSVLAWLGCRHNGLHEKMPGMCPKSTPSQRATTSPWWATAALGMHSNGSLLCE